MLRLANAAEVFETKIQKKQIQKKNTSSESTRQIGGAWRQVRHIRLFIPEI